MVVGGIVQVPVVLGVGDSFGYEYTEDMIPGSTVYGAMLDTRYGRFNTYSANPRYDYERCASVDIEITADRESYKPGETASLKETWELSASDKPAEKAVEEIVSKL